MSHNKIRTITPAISLLKGLLFLKFSLTLFFCQMIFCEFIFLNFNDSFLLVDLLILKLDSNNLSHVPPEIGFFFFFFFIFYSFLFFFDCLFLKGSLPNLETLDLSNNWLKRIPVSIVMFIMKVNALKNECKGIEEFKSGKKKKIGAEELHDWMKKNPMYISFDEFTGFSFFFFFFPDALIC